MGLSFLWGIEGLDYMIFIPISVDEFRGVKTGQDFRYKRHEVRRAVLSWQKPGTGS